MAPSSGLVCTGSPALLRLLASFFQHKLKSLLRGNANGGASVIAVVRGSSPSADSKAALARAARYNYSAIAGGNWTLEQRQRCAGCAEAERLVALLCSPAAVTYPIDTLKLNQGSAGTVLQRAVLQWRRWTPAATLLIQGCGKKHYCCVSSVVS